MTRNPLFRPTLAGLLCLLALAGCAHPGGSVKTQARTPTETMSADNCTTAANNRLALFARPDTYPMSAQERQAAYNALYDECKRRYNWQLAKPNFAPSTTIAATDLATLSPAAGGNPPTTAAAAALPPGSYPPGATVVVINGNTVSQLSSLSPASGGKADTDGVNVVVVQPQALAAPAPVTARPVVAMPMTPPPLAVGHAPLDATPQPPQAAAATLPPAPRAASAVPAAPPPVATAYSYPPASAAPSAPAAGGSQLENIILKN